MSKKGTKTMKQARILIISLAFILSINAFASNSEAIIINTSLSPQQPSPLASLDLFPQATASPKMNLDPKNAVLNSGYKYFNHNIRVSAIGDSLYNVSLISMVALNVADYFSTKEALKYAGLQEVNPMMKPFVKDQYVFAAVKIGFAAISYWSMKSLYKKNKPLAWVLSIASNLAMSYVVSNNLRLINQAKGR
jgi:hypothetical protein